MAITDGSGLSFASQQTNGTAVVVNGATVAVDHAVQFSCDAASAVSGDLIQVTVTCSTTASQTIKGTVFIKVI